MSELSKILPIVLKYEEKGVTEKTVQCLLDAGFKKESIVFADRDGVGNMSKAFDTAFFLSNLSTTKYNFLWFLTNVEFPPEMPLSLLSAFDEETAAVHPAFESSHDFIRDAIGVVPEVPFIEWTAPMVKRKLYVNLYGLDCNLPYWGMDLDFSYRAKQAGYVLKIDGRYRLKHTYLHLHAPEPISEIRKQLRALYDKSTEERLIEKYGENWLQKLWPSHHYNISGRKKLYL